MAAKFLGEFYSHVKSESCAASFTGAIIFRTIEFIKDLGLVCFADPDTRIFNGKGNFIAFTFHTDRNAAFFSVFNRVSNEVL